MCHTYFKDFLSLELWFKDLLWVFCTIHEQPDSSRKIRVELMPQYAYSRYLSYGGSGPAPYGTLDRLNCNCLCIHLPKLAFISREESCNGCITHY